MKMDKKIKEIIDKAKNKSLGGEDVERDTLLMLLEINPDSEEGEYLGSSARDIVRKIYGNKAIVDSSIGIDLTPCKMSCKFCAMGEEWNLIKGEHILPDDVILNLIRGILADGFFSVALRTTEFYDLNRLCELGRKIRKEIPGRYNMSANTGEITVKDAKRLRDAGFNAVYHTLRLREGIDTKFNPEVRLASMAAAREAGLYLACGIDPVGIEHTNGEIIDRIIKFREIKANGVCVMRRVNVKGTPMEGIEEVSDLRMAHIVAVTQIAGGKNWRVVVHPPIRKALEWGASWIAVETGANPRDNVHEVGVWKIFDHATAKQMFLDAGYVMATFDDLKDAWCR